MPPTEKLALTRREKKSEARRAVQYALQCATNGVIRVRGLESDMHERVVNIIQHYGLSGVALDKRDVELATQWLHAKKIVRVSHWGAVYDRHHSVTLLRR